MTDPIADLLTVTRNALARKKSEVIFPFSKVKFNIAKILEKENFVKKAEKREQNYGQIKMILKYNTEGKPAIKNLKRISRPGRKVYAGAKEIPRTLEGKGIIIISTPQGLMTGKDAKKKKLGGEVICEIY